MKVDAVRGAAPDVLFWMLRKLKNPEALITRRLIELENELPDRRKVGTCGGVPLIYTILLDAHTPTEFSQ